MYGVEHQLRVDPPEFKSPVDGRATFYCVPTTVSDIVVWNLTLGSVAVPLSNLNAMEHNASATFARLEIDSVPEQYNRTEVQCKKMDRNTGRMLYESSRVAIIILQQG